MPFCQLYGMVTVNLGLSAGATIVTLPHFTLPSLIAAMVRYQVTTAFLVPAIIRTLTKHAIADAACALIPSTRSFAHRAVAGGRWSSVR